MSKKSNMWLGIGIGGAIVGLGGTVAALAVAHNKAKKQNKTTSQYLKDKALGGMKKNKKRCDKCNEVIPCDCNSITESDYEELCELDEIMSEDFDEFCEMTTEMENLEKERDEWKRKYEELLEVVNTKEK